MRFSSRFPLYFACLLVGAAGLFMAGIGRVGLWDRDEPRYAECSREMLRTGDWVVPRYESGDLRLEKPPGIDWLQAISLDLVGNNLFALRLPSVIGVTVAALVLGITARRFAGPRRALWSVFIFCTCGLAIASSKMCLTDAVLLSTVCIGQGCLAALYFYDRKDRWAPFWIVALLWICTGFAGLVKGPQGVGMHAMTLAILLLLDVGKNFRSKEQWRSAIRWWRQLRPMIGVPLLVLVIAPWVVMVHERSRGVLSALLLKGVDHLSGSMDGHGRPPGFHTILIFGTFFPWSLLLPTALTLAWINRRLPTVRFATAAALGPWILMEIVTTKLPFYVLPAFPGLAFLTADALLRCARGQFDDLRRRIFFFAVGIWCIMTVALGGAPWLSLLITKSLPYAPMAAFSIFTLLYAAIVLFCFWQGKIQRAAMVMGGGMALLIVILFVGILPRLEFLRMSVNLAAAMKQLNAVGPNVKMVMIGYKEPSLAYYQEGGARETDSDTFLQDTPPDLWPQWIVINQDCWNTLPPDIQAKLVKRASVEGVTYAANGKKQTAYVVEKLPLQNLSAGKISVEKLSGENSANSSAVP